MSRITWTTEEFSKYFDPSAVVFSVIGIRDAYYFTMWAFKGGYHDVVSWGTIVYGLTLVEIVAIIIALIKLRKPSYGAWILLALSIFVTKIIVSACAGKNWVLPAILSVLLVIIITTLLLRRIAKRNSAKSGDESKPNPRSGNN